APTGAAPGCLRHGSYSRRPAGRRGPHERYGRHMAETTARVRLDPMTEPEFGPFRESGVRGYAQDKVDSGEWAPDEALDLSRADYRRLLPNGLQSPDQHLFTVRDAESGEPAATLWLALRLRGGRV